MADNADFRDEQDTPSVSHNDSTTDDANLLEQLMDDLFVEDNQKGSE